MKNTKLIWLDEEQAIRFEKCSSDEEKYKVFEEYLTGVAEESKKEFKANLESLEEDVAIYTGLMIRVKQAFEKAKNEQLALSYSVWENFDKEMPSIKDNVEKVVSTLDPLLIKLQNINEQLGKINTWNIERVIETINKFQDLSGKSKEMFEFIVKNFGNQQG